MPPAAVVGHWWRRLQLVLAKTRGMMLMLRVLLLLALVDLGEGTASWLRPDREPVCAAMRRSKELVPAAAAEAVDGDQGGLGLIAREAEARELEALLRRDARAAHAAVGREVGRRRRSVVGRHRRLG